MKINLETKHVSLNTRDPAFYQNPYPTYEALRQKSPIFYWDEYDMWTFVNHGDVTTLLRDRRFGRQILHLTTRETLGWPPEREDLKPFLDVDRLSMLDLEPPDHTRLRSLVQKAFMARQIESLRSQIADLSHKLIDQMAAKIVEDGRVDLLADFATIIPVELIARLLGVPVEKSDELLLWSHAMVGMYELGRSPAQERAAVQAAVEFVAYLRELVGRRRKNPQDDLLSRLIEVEETGERLSEDELISTCILLLNAGHEATVNVIGNGVLALLKNRTLIDQWRADPTITPTAVEELLRFDTPLHLFTRYALEDIDYQGHHFPFGSKIALLLGAANRDPAVFDPPAEINLARSPNPHVSLGGGIHYCLGAPLARLELQVALPILLERLPNLGLAEEPSFRNSYHFRGLESLWVATEDEGP